MHRESTDLTSADRGATMARTGTMVGGRGPRVTTQAPRGVSVGEDDKGGGGQGTEDLAKVHAQVTESILMLINAIVGFPEELKVCDLARSRAISHSRPQSPAATTSPLDLASTSPRSRTFLPHHQSLAFTSARLLSPPLTLDGLHRRAHPVWTTRCASSCASS